MSFLRNHLRVVLIAASAAALGAGASAIASAGASSSAPAKSAHARIHAKRGAGLGKRGRRGALRLAARSVHGDLVVPTRTGFANVSFDRGTVRSLSGQQLTLAEGTRKATYKTLSLTIPGGAVVRVNGKKASLGGVKPDQRVIVIRAPKRTLVIARDPRKSS
jgi:hypothetical protein